MIEFPSISVIILNWNGRVITEKCLDSLIGITNYPKNRLNIILIDNNSNDGSVQFFNHEYKNIIDLISLENNIGFIKGNNYGIKVAINKYNSDYVLLLNNDTEIIEENWLKTLVETATNDEVGIVGPKLIFPNDRIQWSARKIGDNTFFLILQTLTARMNPGFGEPKNQPYTNFSGEANTISGACMLIKSKVIKKIGMLDLTLYPMYQEDVEFSFRVWENGYKVIYRGDVCLIHHESLTINKTSLKTEKFYWALRNSIIVNRRYRGLWNTMIIGTPLFLFYTLFDKKNDNIKLGISNLKFRKNPISQLLIFLKCSKYIFIKRSVKVESP